MTPICLALLAIARGSTRRGRRIATDEKRVEPNSGLGEAFQYLLKRWHKLTLFLRVPGAALDNICERALGVRRT
jgi:hypothetical protein